MGSIILGQLKLRMYAHMKLQGTLEKSGHKMVYGQALLKISPLTTGPQKNKQKNPMKTHQPAT